VRVAEGACRGDLYTFNESRRKLAIRGHASAAAAAFASDVPPKSKLGGLSKPGRADHVGV